MGVLSMQCPYHSYCEAINHRIEKHPHQAHLATDSIWSGRIGWEGLVATTARGWRINDEGSEGTIIKRFGTITVIFVTAVLVGQQQAIEEQRLRVTTERRASATAQSKEEIKSTCTGKCVLHSHCLSCSQIIYPSIDPCDSFRDNRHESNGEAVTNILRLL